MLGNKHSNSTLDVFQVAKKPVKDTVWQELSSLWQQKDLVQVDRSLTASEAKKNRDVLAWP